MAPSPLSTLAFPWTRRAWLATAARTAASTGALLALAPSPRRFWRPEGPGRAVPTSVLADPAHLAALVRRAVEAAQAAGARYADARLTRVVEHRFSIEGDGSGRFQWDIEMVGLGVRALVNGAWGFAAAPLWIGDPTALDAVVPIAHDAVQLAKVTAAGSSRTAELAPVPVVTGTWVTPVTIDPFTVTIEEKLMMINYWDSLVKNAGVKYDHTHGPNYLDCAREERALATSEGTLVTQTLYESGGRLAFGNISGNALADLKDTTSMQIQGIEPAGKGWELFDDAEIPQQLRAIKDALPKKKVVEDSARTGDVGRYTVVCDGATMASLVEHTMGVATQLDRALGYEANAGGTGYITDPLAIVGTLKLASDVVTVTGNRNAPGQLATVKWDEEGVEPQPFTLVKDGVLTDFQTTREQAMWLAPYYARAGRPVRSNGCAAAESAVTITMQHIPNLSLEPSPKPASVADLIATVKDGFFIEHGDVAGADFQARTGLIYSGRSSDFSMRKITNGRLTENVSGLALMYDASDLWKHVTAVGGAETRATISRTRYEPNWELFGVTGFVGGFIKGEPAQVSGHSVQAVAALIGNQTFIDPSRKP